MKLITKAHRLFKRTTRQVERPHHIAPNRLNHYFTVPHPDQAWVSDNTYVRTQEGWLHAAALVEAHAIQLSMSSIGNGDDNAVAECFFHALKLACVEHHT